MIDGDADNSRVPDDQIADVRRIWKRINSVFCVSWCTSIFYFKCTDQCVFLHMHRLATSSLTIPAYACSYPVAFKCMAQATQLLPPFPLFTFIQTGCTGHRLTAFTVLLCHVSQLIKQTVHSHWTTYIDASCIHVHKQFRLTELIITHVNIRSNMSDRISCCDRLRQSSLICMITSCLPARELSKLALISYRAFNNNGLELVHQIIMYAYF